MKTAETVVRSFQLPARTADRLDEIASARQVSPDVVAADLLEAGLESRHYLTLVEQLASTVDPSERTRLKEELARLTFGS